MPGGYGAVTSGSNITVSNDVSFLDTSALLGENSEVSHETLCLLLDAEASFTNSNASYPYLEDAPDESLGQNHAHETCVSPDQLKIHTRTLAHANTSHAIAANFSASAKQSLPADHVSMSSYALPDSQTAISASGKMAATQGKLQNPNPKTQGKKNISKAASRHARIISTRQDVAASGEYPFHCPRCADRKARDVPIIHSEEDLLEHDKIMKHRHVRCALRIYNRGCFFPFRRTETDCIVQPKTQENGGNA